MNYESIKSQVETMVSMVSRITREGDIKVKVKQAGIALQGTCLHFKQLIFTSNTCQSQTTS